VPRGAALLLASVALVLPSACGESEQEKFRDSYDPVSEKLTALGDEVGEALREAQGGKEAELADRLERFARDLADLGDEVEELDAPDALERDVAALGDAIADVERTLRSLANELQGEARNVRTSTIQLLQEGLRLDRIQRKVAREAREEY
jgi:septation ring formation regulator EzrA